MNERIRQRGRCERRALGTTGTLVALLLVARVSSAQPTDGGAPTAAPSPSANETGNPTPSASPTAAAASAGDAGTSDIAALAKAVAETRADLAEQKKALADQKKAVGDAQKSADDAQKSADDAASKADAADKPDIFRIYGFTEVGLQRSWAKADSEIAPFEHAGATSFVLGNIDLYLDAQPLRDWRSLVEVRLTNAPQGEITTYGGLGGTFKRVSTRYQDPNAAALIAYSQGASLVIERAQIDWTANELLKLRFGNFFTPFGIYNQDHGAPTLISIAIPTAIANGIIPIRQTGIMAYGDKIVHEWELGYQATVTNGRQELSNFAFDDDRGFGVRVYSSLDKGDLVLKFGASGYTGRVKDQEIDITSVTPTLSYSSHSTYSYRETVGGLDASVDIHKTRIRSEVFLRKVDYDTGQHESAGTPGVSLPNRWENSAYALVAQQLPFWGLEPYVMTELMRSPIAGLGDTVVSPSIGLNVRFNSSVMLKTQVEHLMFFDSRGVPGNYAGVDPANNNFTAAFSRLILVF